MDGLYARNAGAVACHFGTFVVGYVTFYFGAIFSFSLFIGF
jgi:hypothetical protein